MVKLQSASTFKQDQCAYLFLVKTPYERMGVSSNGTTCETWQILILVFVLELQGVRQVACSFLCFMRYVCWHVPVWGGYHFEQNIVGRFLSMKSFFFLLSYIDDECLVYYTYIKEVIQPSPRSLFQVCSDTASGHGNTYVARSQHQCVILLELRWVVDNRWN